MIILIHVKLLCVWILHPDCLTPCDMCDPWCKGVFRLFRLSLLRYVDLSLFPILASPSWSFMFKECVGVDHKMCLIPVLAPPSPFLSPQN